MTDDVVQVIQYPSTVIEVVQQGPVGVVSDASMAAVVADPSSLTATELNATIVTQIASQIAPPTSYTWDATTGSIATIVEHYAAPVGDRTTTYGGYNAAGDPTTELDPDGSHWVLGYDANGNLISRTAA